LRLNKKKKIENVDLVKLASEKLALEFSNMPFQGSKHCVVLEDKLFICYMLIDKNPGMIT
jgi:hypothetical protein